MNTNTLEQSQDTTAIKTIREQLKAKKRGQAVRELATPLLQAWTNAIEGNNPNLDDLTGLPELMSEVLSVRDAAIIAAINPQLSMNTIIDIAANPDAPYSKDILNQTLQDGFDNPDAKPDRQRLVKAAGIARSLTGLASEEKYQAQPFAISAYLAWWDGNSRDASFAAVSALDADPNTSLAMLVISALMHDKKPAYLN